MRRLRYSVPYIAGKNLPKDSDPAPRGAGQSCGTGRPNWPNFNPPAPCGAGHGCNRSARSTGIFQSTRPLRGGTYSAICSAMFSIFQSTRPLRGGTSVALFAISVGSISIHPPLAGRDLSGIACGYAHKNFNPPVPCGAGPGGRMAGGGCEIFQSTRPLRGGTTHRVKLKRLLQFQSTRPLRGGTTPAAAKAR